MVATATYFLPLGWVFLIFEVRLRRRSEESVTFEQDVLLAETKPMIRRLAEKNWEASRKESSIDRTVVLKVETAQFQILTRSQTPFSPPASCEEHTRAWAVKIPASSASA
jgi:hypothetical protein